MTYYKVTLSKQYVKLHKPNDAYELAELLNNIKGISEVKPYTLINNWGCTFIKNGEKHDMRRWINCYGVDAGWSCSHSKGDSSYNSCINYIFS